MNAKPDQSKSQRLPRPGLGWRGLTLQLIFVTILPLTALLLLVAFASIRLHQNAMRSLVGERDQRAVRTAAGALGAQMEQRSALLQDFARQISMEDPAALGTTLERSAALQREFDGGVAVFDAQGNLLAATGAAALLESPAAGTAINNLLSPGKAVFFSNAFPHPLEGESLVAISTISPLEGSDSGPLVVVGAFSPGVVAHNTLAGAFAGETETAGSQSADGSQGHTGGQATVMVFDASRQLVYHSGSLPSEGEPAAHPGVAEALAGQSGAIFIPADDSGAVYSEHVVAFAPVALAGWALVVEEPWEMVASPLLSYTQIAPLVLAPVLLFTLFALWFGLRQIVQPLQALEEQADALAWGNYRAVEKPVGGIAEIQRLQAGLVHMSQKVQASQQSLHGYIGAITAGQEEERRRLARELHDDTIQALIALKQRVQLAQLNQAKGSPQSLAELEELTEKTIDNLRRVTRALRPIYLEDLGLLAALEMLAREVAEVSGIQVEFRAAGREQRLSPKEELALYRIAQEALSNVARHARATHASLQLSYLPEEVRLEVTDNGQGFQVPRSPADFAPGGHYGLLGLYERAELIGAGLSIDSAPGQGARVSVRLHMDGARPHAQDPR